MRNSEKCYSIKEILEDPSSFATKFSEGNSSLKSLLNFCYSNNIATRACCTGHADQNINNAYVNFEVPPDQISLYAILVDVLYKSDLKDVLQVEIEHTEYKPMNIILRVPIQYKNQLFLSVENVFKQGMNMSVENKYSKLLEVYSRISSFNNYSKNISIQMQKGVTKILVSQIRYYAEFGEYLYGTSDITNDSSEFINYLNSINDFDYSNFSEINNNYVISDKDIDLMYQMPFMNNDLSYENNKQI